MTPEASLHLQRAKKLLTEAGSLLSDGYNDAAGRTAYMAGFHAAQALIAEKTGTAEKTHSSVQSEFQRLVKDDEGFDPFTLGFLSRSYTLKTQTDYSTEPDFKLAPERAASAVEGAHWFVAHISGLLESA